MVFLEKQLRVAHDQRQTDTQHYALHTPPSLSHSLASTGLYYHSEDRLTVHIYMWSAWLKVCTYMHMYFLVSKGFTLSVVTPGVLVKNLKNMPQRIPFIEKIRSGLGTRL